MATFIPIESIRVSAKQARRIAAAKVAAHRTRIQTGDVLPITCAALGDGTYVIRGNGRHRYFAYLEEGFPSIPVEVAA